MASSLARPRSAAGRGPAGVEPAAAEPVELAGDVDVNAVGGGTWGVQAASDRAARSTYRIPYSGPPPPSGGTQVMIWYGSRMSQVLQWTQFEKSTCISNRCVFSLGSML